MPSQEQQRLQKKRCFIITPIGGDNDQIRRHIDGIIDAAIIPIFGDEYDIKVAHRLPNSGSINKQVIQLIYKSDLVIANLTNKNPNVMYELAFRHCVDLPCIMIAEKGTELPFDISTERTIFYINDSKGVIELKNDLSKCLNSIHNPDFVNSNPIYDNLKSIFHEAQIIKNVSTSESKANAIEYIIQRLDSMQNFINKSPFSADVVYPHKCICSIGAEYRNKEKELKSAIRYMFAMQSINIFAEVKEIEINDGMVTLNLDISNGSLCLDDISRLLTDAIALANIPLKISVIEPLLGYTN